MKLDTLIYDIIDMVLLAANKIQCSSSTYSTAVKFCFWLVSILAVKKE